MSDFQMRKGRAGSEVRLSPRIMCEILQKPPELTYEGVSAVEPTSVQSKNIFMESSPSKYFFSYCSGDPDTKQMTAGYHGDAEMMSNYTGEQREGNPIFPHSSGENTEQDCQISGARRMSRFPSANSACRCRTRQTRRRCPHARQSNHNPWIHAPSSEPEVEKKPAGTRKRHLPVIHTLTVP